MALQSLATKQDEPQWLLAGMELPDQSIIADSSAFHEQYLFGSHIAEMRAWRYKKCSDMLETINRIMQAELHRIKNDSPQL